MFPALTNAVRTLLIAGVITVVAHLGSLMQLAEGNMRGYDILSGREPTPGTTWLLVGSDARWGQEGARSDVIMLLHQPEDGATSLVSIPRFASVQIPGIGLTRIMHSFEWGGAPLLVRTVENLTGLTIDRYLEIEMTGMHDVINALGGVNLCLDQDVNDQGRSYLQWAAGCHLADGATTIAFARFRDSETYDDVDRSARHRQILSAAANRIASPAYLANPYLHRHLVKSTMAGIRVDNSMQLADFARLALAFRDASGPQGFTGYPPTTEARDLGIGYIIEFEPAAIDQFWAGVRYGNLGLTQ